MRVQPRVQVQEYIFTKYICSMDPATMSMHGFNCFQAFFADVNNSSGVWRASGRDGQKSGCKINGPPCPQFFVSPSREPVGRAAGTCQSQSLSPLVADPKHLFCLDRGLIFRAAGARALERRQDAQRHHLPLHALLK